MSDTPRADSRRLANEAYWRGMRHQAMADRPVMQQLRELQAKYRAEMREQFPPSFNGFHSFTLAGLRARVELGLDVATDRETFKAYDRMAVQLYDYKPGAHLDWLDEALAAARGGA